MSAPHLPDCPPVSVDGMSLAEIRDYMAQLPPDRPTEDAILTIVGQWHDDPDAHEPLGAIQALLNSFRELPRGERRMSCMNTFVRTLGRSENLATVLDMMRMAARRRESREHELVRVSLDSSKHSVYGWCGQTKILRSGVEPARGIMMPEAGVQELLGKTPTTAWSLSMHIWQANPSAKGFRIGQTAGPAVLAEPPHTHPFDFASMVAIGSLHQSIYRQRQPGDASVQAGTCPGRYDDTDLEHVHGIWPPHANRETSGLATIEERVRLDRGDSYYMPCDMIHDVQADAATSTSKPAITLFLRAESIVMPHAYIAREMAEHHEAHPDILYAGYPLAEEAWHVKLERVSSYLRGHAAELKLDEVVRYDGDYAFFHV